MYKMILVPIDHSVYGARALAAAAGLARPLDAKVIVVHAEEGISWDEALALGPLPPDMRGNLKQEDVELLESAQKALKEAGIDAETQLLTGSGPITNRILTAAEKLKADLIVIGARGSSELAGLLLGSVSHKLIQLAHCPVLVVR